LSSFQLHGGVGGVEKGDSNCQAKEIRV
jgi:hypothetical protein